MDILIGNLNTPGFIENYIYSNLEQLAMSCMGLTSFLCMICMFGRDNYLNKKRLFLFFLPTIGSIILMTLEACFVRFTLAFSTWDFIESIIYSYGSLLYNPILVFCLYKEKRLRRMIEMILCYGVIGMWASMVLTTIVVMHTDYYETFTSGKFSIFDLTQRYQLLYIRVNVVFCGLFVLFMYFFCYRKHRYIRLRMRYFVSVLYGWQFIALYISKACSEAFKEYQYNLTRLWGGFLLGLISISLPIFMILIKHRKILSEKNMAQEEYLESQLKYIEQYKMSQEKTRKFRHDILNQLSFMQYLLRDDKEQEVKQQLEELLGQIKALSPKYVTGDEMLDCIVAMKAEKMEAQGIDFAMDGIIDGGLPMKPLEICTIFANVLDNAIEAVKKIGEEKKKWVTMSMKKTEQFWVINVSNATKERPDIENMSRGEGYTSKTDSLHHGIGIRNIKKTVEKREGIMKLDGGDERFSLTVMLPRAS